MRDCSNNKVIDCFLASTLAGWHFVISFVTQRKVAEVWRLTENYIRNRVKLYVGKFYDTVPINNDIQVIYIAFVQMQGSKVVLNAIVIYELFLLPLCVETLRT